MSLDVENSTQYYFQDRQDICETSDENKHYGNLLNYSNWYIKNHLEY